MKNYKQDFDDKLQDDSYDDGTLLSIARDYIAELQDMVTKLEEKNGIQK